MFGTDREKGEIVVRLRPFLVLLLFAVIVAVGALSESRAQTVIIITDIRVEGAQRIERETVLSYMTIRPGDPFDPVRMDQSLKNLFDTGLFSDVTLRREVTVLVVRVVENPVVNRVAFEGNSQIDDEELAAEVQLRPRVVYTRTKVQNDLQRILEVYRRAGRFGATIEPKAITLPQNRVDVVFEINEGEETGIERISFIGNREFSDGELREQIITTETVWYNFLTSNDTYDPDRLTFDRELLRRFYLSEGYADFRIVSAVAELAPDRSGFYVTFTVDEGERYRFGEVVVSSSIENLSDEDLFEAVTFEQGDWYDATQIEKTITNLTARVGELGFAFVDIRPDVQRNPEERTLSVTFIITEGPRVFVERINITGNERTLDYVIRRELLLVEGDPFNAARVQASRRRLDNLQFFETVEIENIQGTEPDRTIINVQVVERPTGEFSLGAGFSTDSGPLASVGVSEANFLGRGQNLRAAFAISSRTQQIDVGFTQPYFLGYNMTAGIDLLRRTFDVADNDSFSQETSGGEIRLGYEPAENWIHVVKYSARLDNITDVSASASTAIQLAAGETFTSLIGQTITYDVRDNRQQPTEGFFISLSTDFAGLGGGANFYRILASGGVYVPLWWEGWQWSLSVEAGMTEGIDDIVRIQHREFLGGNELRGFAPSGVGPRDLATNDPLGGNYFYAGSIELAFPLGLPESLGVKGVVFSDFGSLGGLDQTTATTVDTKSLRASVGFGVQIVTPFGPVRVDIAHAILKESFDETQTVHFSFGTSF